MNRQKLLIGLLIVVALTALPVLVIDRTNAGVKQELAELKPEMDLLREKALKAREIEKQLAAEQQSMAALPDRLIGQEPFADMHREVHAVAAKAGLQVRELSLVGAEPVEALPDLIEYTATVELAGTTAGFIEFTRLLEQHRLLIRIPDLNLKLPDSAPAADGSGFRTRLTLHFYGKAPGSK